MKNAESVMKSSKKASNRNNISIFKKAVILLELLAMFSALFGCGESRSAQHEISELRSISMSCGHSNHCYSYSFFLRKEGETWLFDAECFTKDREEETVFSSKAVGDGELEALFDILERSGTIAYAESYKKPKKFPFTVLDAPMYGFALTFTDGSVYNTDSAGDARHDLEDFFYRLAEAE